MSIVFTPDNDHQKDRHVVGDLVMLVGTLTFTGNYATGGVDLDLRPYLWQGVVHGVLTEVRGNDPEYDNANRKLKLYASANTEHTAAAFNAALTAAPVPVVIIGR